MSRFNRRMVTDKLGSSNPIPGPGCSPRKGGPARVPGMVARHKKRSPGTQVPGLLRTFQSKVYDWPPGSPSLAYFAPDWSTMYFMGFTVVPLTCTS